MGRNILNQCARMSKKWTVLFVYLFLCAMVLVHFFNNVNMYKGRDVIEMFHPMAITTLTSDSSEGFLLMQLFPILVVLGCGFSYFEDRSSGTETFLIGRSGAKNYYFSKIIATFLVTMCAFTLPFLLEIVLNVCAFPLEATGLMLGRTEYEMVSYIREYLFFDVYMLNPYVYAVLHVLMFGVWAGVLAAFVVALSFLSLFKVRLLLFLPIYVCIQILALIKALQLVEAETIYFFYFFMFEGGNLSRIAYWIALFGVVIVIVAITYWKSREDCRNR